jgi:hypothetical protein
MDWIFQPVDKSPIFLDALPCLENAEHCDGVSPMASRARGSPSEVLTLSETISSDLSLTGDSDEADRHSELIAITVPGWIRSVVGAKRRWRMDFAESDRDRQAWCC